MRKCWTFLYRSICKDNLPYCFVFTGLIIEVCQIGWRTTGVHLRRWGIDACPAQPQNTVKETKYSLNRKTQLMNVQPQSQWLIAIKCWSSLVMPQCTQMRCCTPPFSLSRQRALSFYHFIIQYFFHYIVVQVLADDNFCFAYIYFVPIYRFYFSSINNSWFMYFQKNIFG